MKQKYTTYREYFNQGLDESFQHVVSSQRLRTEMESHPVGTPEHHINAAKMFSFIALHNDDLTKFHNEQGNPEKAQIHARLATEARQSAKKHLAQFHFAHARNAAEAGDIKLSIEHQTKGEQLTR